MDSKQDVAMSSIEALVKSEASVHPPNMALKKLHSEPDELLVPIKALYQRFDCKDDIYYTPEASLETLRGMVETLKRWIERLQIENKLRKEVWSREISGLERAVIPTIIIAVCGATGAGKSSLLNAILDDNIVPTSGMRACTAVPTEIAYHAVGFIEADIFFLSKEEWKEELTVLLWDLIDKDGKMKRPTELRGDSAVAWHKLSAVYPKTRPEKLSLETAESIIDSDPEIAMLLGTTQSIAAKDSAIFAGEIARYIESNDTDRERTNKNGDNGETVEETRHHKAALWPLIREIKVRCNSKALSTGAILVDLPGVADANAARSSIAKNYMRKCDCVWILAPITRAIDDKIARDLLGDAFKSQMMSIGQVVWIVKSFVILLTEHDGGRNSDGRFADVNHMFSFIATKCDDVSCSEIVRALSLEKEPDLLKIESRIDLCRTETIKYNDKKASTSAAVKLFAQEVDGIIVEIAEIADDEIYVKAMERVTITSKVTGPTKVNKRKNTRAGKAGHSKRGRIDMESMVASEDCEVYVDEDFLDTEGRNFDAPKLDGRDELFEEDDSLHASFIAVAQAKFQEKNEELERARQKLKEAKAAVVDFEDMVAILKKRELEAQKEKNAFCSLKRSEYSRAVLQEDFRAGLKTLDDDSAEAQDPDSFDPEVDLRDYSKIDLPTFLVSSRDYSRLTKQVNGDGDPSCFSNTEDTGIPGLQKWCRTLTSSRREQAARKYRTQFRTFLASILNYVEGVGAVTKTDRDALRQRWESNVKVGDQDEEDSDEEESFEDHSSRESSDTDDIPTPAALDSEIEKSEKEVSAMEEPNLNGIIPALRKSFADVVQNNVKQLQQVFKDTLEENCQKGAAKAIALAVDTSDDFASSMHWGTYRATLRRHGEWQDRDLNAELMAPMTLNIASSWATVFESNLTPDMSFKSATTEAVKTLLKDVEDSAKIGLKDCVQKQGDVALDETRITVEKTVSVVTETIQTKKREVSRCLAPHMLGEMRDAYDHALNVSGPGSVKRQKKLFHDFIVKEKENIFNGGAKVLLDRLDNIALAVGQILERLLARLAEKVEISVSVLWEGAHDDPSQHLARQQVIEIIQELTVQLQLWDQADASRLEL